MRPPSPPFGIHAASGWWADIEARYAVPARAYHSAAHVHEVLEQWSWVDSRGLWVDRASTWVAVLLHDAVYVAGRSDNEARSAELVPEWCKTFAVDAEPVRAADLIRLTARHGKLTRAEVDEEAALFLDCDMAILASEPARFDRYGEQVREEYAALAPSAVFEAGRRQFLERLLARPIFLSDTFRERFEPRARDNIRRALAAM